MPLIIPPNYGHVIHSMTLTGDPDPYAITYGVQFNENESTTTAAQLLALHTAFKDAWCPSVPSSYILRQTEMRWKSSADTLDRVNIHTGDFGGTSAGSMLPQNCAYLVHKRTQFAGRRYRGRVYFPGVSEGAADDLGNLTSGTVSSTNTRLAAWLAAVRAVVGIENMVILHTEGVSLAPAPTAIEQLLCDPVIGTQRRRLRH